MNRQNYYKYALIQEIFFKQDNTKYDIYHVSDFLNKMDLLRYQPIEISKSPSLGNKRGKNASICTTMERIVIEILRSFKSCAHPFNRCDNYVLLILYDVAKH